MQNPSLQDIQLRRAQIQAQIKALTEEDQELAAAQRTLEKLAGVARGEPSHPVRQAPPANATTVVQQIIYILGVNQIPWMTSEQIRNALKSAFDRDVPISTVGPTLSFLKKAKIIERDGLTVALRHRIQTNKAATG